MDGGTYAVNASDSEGGSFRIGCLHASCKAAGRDRLDFLLGFIEQGLLPQEALNDNRFLFEGGEDDVGALKAKFPLPSRSFGAFDYRLFDGRPWVYEMDESDSQETQWDRLFTPFTIMAGVRYADRSDQLGLRVLICDENGDAHTLDLEAGLAVKGYGAELKTRLRERGVVMTDAGEKRLIQLFKQIQPPAPVVIYDRPGWRDGVFLTPWGQAIGSSSNQPVELCVDNRPPGADAAGTLEGWTGAVNAVFETDILHFQVAVASAFVSPIIDLCGYPTIWLAYTGPTSKGKTTALKLQACAWGDPAPKKGLLGTFNATLRSTEALLERASGAGFAFDEARMIDGRDLQTLVFKAASDGGADRLTRDASLKKARRWSLMVSLSGETSLLQKVKAANDTITTGLGTRLLDLNVEEAPALDRARMERIEDAFRNYGHAGPAFVRTLINAGYAAEPERLMIEVENLADYLAGANADAALRRAARIAALVGTAGRIAKDAGLIPSDFDVDEMARKLWAKALEAETAPASSTDLAIRTLFEALIKRRGVDIAIDLYGVNREAVAWRLEQFEGFGDVYIVPTSNLADLAGGALDHTAVARALARQDLLIPNRRTDKKSNVWDSVPGLGRLRAVVIPAKAVEEADTLDQAA